MKIFLFSCCLLWLSNVLQAQDTVKKLQMPLNGIRVKKTIAVQQSISNQIDVVLDSLINSTKGKELFVNNVISNIETVLYSYWKNGQLIGTKSSQAYFVQCGKQTMTQLQIDKGVLIVSVGIAVNKRAEFELLRFERSNAGKQIIIND